MLRAVDMFLMFYAENCLAMESFGSSELLLSMLAKSLSLYAAVFQHTPCVRSASTKAAFLCRFSHPVGTLATSALEINDGQGVIEALNNTGANGDLCGGFTIRARVPFTPWDTLQTTVGVTVQGAEVTDVYGVAFPTYTNTSTLDHR